MAGRSSTLGDPEPSARSWLSQSERGTVLGLHAFYWFATVFGRGPSRLLVRGIALWYTLFARRATQASRGWLSTVFERPARWSEVYRHILYFAQTAADRLWFAQGKTAAFTVTQTGHAHIEQALQAGAGAILLGAHVGSFEAMRAGSHQAALPLTILGHFDNAAMINALLRRLDPLSAARVVHISAQSIDFIFTVRERLEAGELLGTMGDRVGLNEKSVEVLFFGRPARFPTGPFVLASVLKCPVFLTFGLYREPNHYDLFCEPLVDHVVLSRKTRQQDLRALVQRYATRLEHYCRRAPYNWFNFYDFWAKQEHQDSPRTKTPS